MKNLEITETSKTDILINKMQKWLFRIFILFIILATIFVGVTFVNIMPVDSKSEETIVFVVEKGMGRRDIINSLKDKDLIKNKTFAKIYIGIFDSRTVYPGTYNLSKSMGLQEIIEVLASGKNLENEEISVTFIEGKNYKYYIEKITENFDIKEEDIKNLAKNKEYLNGLIKEYWFLGEEILNNDIYFSLEGYLFPDTYSFRKQATLEEIIKVLLDRTAEILEPYRETIEKSDYKIHSLLTLASVVELEAVSDEDRAMVAELFYKRLNNSMALGSDVTTYYGADKDMKLKLESDDIDSCNAYNTRGICARKGLPVGPICAVSESSIKAVLNPKEHDYLYFVADKNGKLYFAHTYDEHKRIVDDLKKKGLWAA